MAARGGDEGQRRGGGRPMGRGPPGPIHNKPGPRFEPVDREKVTLLFLCFFDSFISSFVILFLYVYIYIYMRFIILIVVINAYY